MSAPRRSGLWLGLGVAVLLAVFAWTSMRGSRITCQVCLSYEGRRNCASAAAPSKDEAVQTATNVACATIAPGRAASMACEREVPLSVSCPP